MVSKRWQRQQSFIAHAALFIGFGLPMFVLESLFLNWQKLAIVIIGYLLLFPSIRWLHKRYANQFVKVFECDYQVASRIVQRTLNAKRLPFVKRTGDEEIVFTIRPGDIKLIVSDFSLNLMIDDHLTTKIATMFTLKPETSKNADQMKQLQLMLDDALALQGF